MATQQASSLASRGPAACASQRRAAADGGGQQQHAVAGGGRQQQARAQVAWGSRSCGRTMVTAAGREKKKLGLTD